MEHLTSVLRENEHLGRIKSKSRDRKKKHKVDVINNDISSKEQVKQWIETFSSCSRTNWIVKQTTKKAAHGVLYRYACGFSRFNKTRNPGQSQFRTKPLSVDTDKFVLNQHYQISNVHLFNLHMNLIMRLYDGINNLFISHKLA